MAIVTGSGWDIRKMAAEMPLDIFNQWLAFADLHPLFFDADYVQARADWNAGMVAATVLNTMTGLWSKRPAWRTAVDMMFKPKPREPERQKSPKELYMLFKTAVMLNTAVRH